MAIQQFRRLTLEEFETAVSKSRMRDKAVIPARLVLVEGLKATVAAEETGISKQALYAACLRIWGEFVKDNPLPENWAREMVELPQDRMKAIQKESMELKNEALKKQAIKGK